MGLEDRSRSPELLQGEPNASSSCLLGHRWGQALGPFSGMQAQHRGRRPAAARLAKLTARIRLAGLSAAVSAKSTRSLIESPRTIVKRSGPTTRLQRPDGRGRWRPKPAGEWGRQLAPKHTGQGGVGAIVRPAIGSSATATAETGRPGGPPGQPQTGPIGDCNNCILRCDHAKRCQQTRSRTRKTARGTWSSNRIERKGAGEWWSRPAARGSARMRPGNRSPIALNGDCHCVRSATRISRTSSFATLIRPRAIERSGRS